jgi:endoglucanase
VVFDGSTPLNQLYPGDAWVDWISIDGYNWGNTQGWSAWQSLADIFVPTHDEIGRLTNRPMMLSEVASTEIGGNKANWITQGFLTDLAKRLPRIRAVVWFNENKEQDWRMNSTAASLKAWSKVATSPQYKGRLP